MCSVHLYFVLEKITSTRVSFDELDSLNSPINRTLPLVVAAKRKFPPVL